MPRTEAAMAQQGVTDLEVTRNHVLQQLKPWAAENPEQPVYGGAGGKVVTRQDILEAVEQGTEGGQRMLQRWHRLAMEHIVNADLLRKEREPLKRSR